MPPATPEHELERRDRMFAALVRTVMVGIVNEEVRDAMTHA